MTVKGKGKKQVHANTLFSRRLSSNGGEHLLRGFTVILLKIEIRNGAASFMAPVDAFGRHC